ncbi:MAG: hypothetical protein BIFFINMI_02933 [Phycisphaerae bacterium]|nr:hypothetical protein [Phycisphaerae bacterium]
MTRAMMAVAVLLLAAGPAAAEVKSMMVDYNQGGTKLSGYLAWDDAQAGPRPGVLICHAWRGLDAYSRSRAEQLAGMGYIAFALDMYGKDVVATNNATAAALSGALKRDVPLMRARASAGLAVLTSQKNVDPKRIAVIGYCFGGTVALELARGGADVAGVVAFHGGLDTPHPEQTRNVRPKILVCHGGDDPHVTPEQVLAFWKEMKDAGADYQILVLSGAVHAFSDPSAGNDPSKGAAYSKQADERSWSAMNTFFAEVFAPPPGPKSLGDMAPTTAPPPAQSDAQAPPAPAPGEQQADATPAPTTQPDQKDKTISDQVNDAIEGAKKDLDEASKKLNDLFK